jgi:DNA-binding NtrC family response regulator
MNERDELQNNHVLLIADPKKNVREFLKREMHQNGYRVLTAKTGKEIMAVLKNDPSIELLIIDPNLPDVTDWSIFTLIENHTPRLPVIIHTYIQDYAEHVLTHGSVHFIEKRGNSVSSLRKIIEKVLRETKP